MISDFDIFCIKELLKDLDARCKLDKSKDDDGLIIKTKYKTVELLNKDLLGHEYTEIVDKIIDILIAEKEIETAFKELIDGSTD